VLVFRKYLHPLFSLVSSLKSFMYCLVNSVDADYSSSEND